MITEFTGTSTGGCDVPERRAQPDESPPGRLEPLSMKVSSEWSRERRAKPRLLPGLLPLSCPPGSSWRDTNGILDELFDAWKCRLDAAGWEGGGRERKKKTNKPRYLISERKKAARKEYKRKKKESVTTSSVHSQCLSVVRAVRVRRASSRLKPRPPGGSRVGKLPSG